MNITPVNKLSPHNFLAICDVAMDIKEELQMTQGDIVTIPIMRTIIRPAPFNILLPAKSVELLDNYCELRVKATDYMKIEGAISHRDLVLAYQRWDNSIKITINRKKFGEFYDNLIKIYEIRVVQPNKKIEPEEIPKMTYNSITGIGKFNGKDFKLKDNQPDYRLLKILLERLGLRVKRGEVLVAIYFYEDGEEPDETRKSAETEAINDVVKKLRKLTGLNTKQLANNNGNLTLSGVIA